MMFETPLTLVGRIVNDPVMRHVGDEPVVNFRMASNSRRRNTQGEWEAGNSLFVNVSCWGKLATGVMVSVKKGDAVVATGFVFTNEYEGRDGVRRSSMELRAKAVGPDLAFYQASLSRVVDNEQLRGSTGASNQSEADLAEAPAEVAECEDDLLDDHVDVGALT